MPVSQLHFGLPPPERQVQNDVPQLPVTRRKFGKHRNGLQRFRCDQCRKTFTEDHATPLDSMRLPMDKAAAILKLMVEGMSVRSIERITGVHRDTILRLLLLAAEKITAKLRHEFENLVIERIQC